MFSFGAGVLLGFRSDVANATPVNFGLLQEMSFDINFNLKELYGQYQFPVAIARGTGKVTGKAKVARISGLVFNDLFLGQTMSAGQVATAFGEAGAVPGSSAYTVTVANSANFVDDYGVVSATTGLPLKKVASSPATGEYSVSAGVYTFNSAQANAAVLISYTHTVSGSGQKFTMANQLLGHTPTFQAQFFSTFQGKPVNIKMLAGTSGKLGFGTKLEDFVVPEMDFSFHADAAGNVLTWSFGEVS